jgi:signal transduction histidine kinase
MRRAAGRLLIVDAPLAVAVGAASLAASRAAQLPEQLGEGPWRHGPRDRLDFADQTVPWGVIPGGLVIAVGVAMRRIWPRASFVAIVLAVAGYLAQGAPYGPVLLAPALSLHALASALPLNRWAPLTLLLVPMLMAAYWDQPWFGLLDPTLYGALVIGFAVMVVPAMVGLLRRNRRESERLERDQELHSYAYEERLQIAREVHDVVGHSLSVINLQAGVALHVLHKRPDDVEASLEAIKRTSREALAELRTTLAVFRDPTAGEPLAPRPGLDRLVDQAAYRIIQEALTNVVRHAGGAPARLTISRGLNSVSVTVEDDGPGRPSGAAEGNGILGMRERARAVGGTLSITQGHPSGFRVVADLPLNGEAE